MTTQNISFIKEAFKTEQETLAVTLKSTKRIQHQGDKGAVCEQRVIDFLKRYLPNRYTVDKASVIDSEGNVSESIDIVIYDRQYSPALLDCDDHKYVPVESVYAVFECKQNINKDHIVYAGKKAFSVRNLTRTSASFAHLGGVDKKAEHFEIIGGLIAIKVDWADRLGDSFTGAVSGLAKGHELDSVLAVEGDAWDSYDAEDHFAPNDNALVYFAFRLLHKLQSMGTAPAVDWMAYADQLSKEVKDV